jgi:hypothetical protein
MVDFCQNSFNDAFLHTDRYVIKEKDSTTFRSETKKEGPSING